MPVLGLLLTLEDGAAGTRARVAAALAMEAHLECGEPVAHRWPVVLETSSEVEAESRVEALRAVPGVAGVDVVYADFEDLLARPAEPHAREES